MRVSSFVIDIMPKFAFLCLLSILWTSPKALAQKKQVHPEFDMTLEQRIKHHGYPVETHKVITEDGYILSICRIPHGPKNESNNRSVVVMLHGMGGAPHNFVALGSKKSIAYYLVDRGIEVWLFGARGSVGPFYPKHKTLDWNKDKEFWLYSMHEIGKYDLAATIDYIRNYTGQKKVSLIGHSAGGNEIYCLLAERPEYNEKVKVGISWGSSPILRLQEYPFMLIGCLLVDLVKGIVRYTDMAEVLPIMTLLKPTIRLMTADPFWQEFLIKVSWVIGSHKSYIQRPEAFQILVSNIPRVSTRMFLHFMDNIKNGDFRQYDHGPKINKKVYGQKTPPLYNLTAVTAPMAFFVGPKDSEVCMTDVMEATRRIPNVVLLQQIEYPYFTHLDYITGHNASEILYEPTYRLIKAIDDGIVLPPINLPPSDQ